MNHNVHNEPLEKVNPKDVIASFLVLNVLASRCARCVRCG